MIEDATRPCLTCTCEGFAGLPDDRYCSRCGHPAASHAAPAPQPATWPCWNCGCADMLGDPDAAFCARCGHPADHHQQATAAAEAESPAGSAPCTRCDCPEVLGDPGTRFCARCGHPAADHRAAETAVAAACTDCDCGEFLGGASAAFCARCGHTKTRHGANAAEHDASDLDTDIAPIVDAKAASVVSSEQPPVLVEAAAVAADESQADAPTLDEPASELPTEAEQTHNQGGARWAADSEPLSYSEPATEDGRTDPTTGRDAPAEQADPPTPALDEQPSAPMLTEHDEPREVALAEQIRDDPPDASTPLAARPWRPLRAETPGSPKRGALGSRWYSARPVWSSSS